MVTDEIRKMMETLMNDMKDAVFYIAKIDQDNSQHIYLSDGFESLLGYPKEKSLNDFSFFYKILHPEDSKRVEKQILESDYKTTVQFRIRKSNGEYIKCISHNYSKVIDGEEYAYGLMTKIGWFKSGKSQKIPVYNS